jgi:hypothetical protein
MENCGRASTTKIPSIIRGEPGTIMKVTLSRTVRAGIAGLLMLSLSSLGSVSAADRGAVGAHPDLSAGITVQNQSSTTANIVIRMIDPTSGGQVLAVSDQVPGNANTQYYLPTDPRFAGLPSGFRGSAVIDSDQPVAATVNIAAPTAAGTGTFDPFRVTTYTGLSDTEAGQTLYLPEVTRYGGYNSTVWVQNAGNVDASVSITYRGGNGAVISSPGCTTSTTIKPAATYAFPQQNCAGLGSTFNGSAVVTSATAGAPIAAVVTKTNSFGDISSAQFMSYNGAVSGGRTLYVPKIVKGYYGFDGGMTIQNISGSTATQVVITFTFGGVTKTRTVTIQPQAAASFFLPTMVLDDGTRLPNGNGSAVITSSAADVVATVNERNDTPGTSTLGQADTYRAMVQTAATMNISLPSLNARYYGFVSGFSIQNAGSADGTGTITLTKGSQVRTFSTGTIPAGAKRDFKTWDLWPDADFNGSGSISFSQPAFAMVNLAHRADIDPRFAQKVGDTETIYVGLNR